MFWIAAEVVEVDGELRHRLRTEIGSRLLDPAVEYRLVWDNNAGMWRVDKRAHAEGG